MTESRFCVPVLVAIGLLLGCAPHRSAPVPETRSPVYSLDVRLRPTDRAMDVSGTLVLPPDSTQRDSLTLSLSERFSALDVEVLEPSVSRGPAGAVQVNIPNGPRVPGESRSARWVVRPSRPFPRGEPIKLRFSSSGGGDISFLYYVGPEVAFATGWGDEWYPLIRGGKKSLGTGEIAVHVPPGWKVITGAESRSTNEEKQNGTFRFSQDYPTYFTFVAGPYSIVTRDSGSGPAVTAWLLTPRAHSTEFLNGAARMVATLETEFGKLPFGSMALVEVPRAVAQQAGFNAFSPAGFLVLNHRAFDVSDVKNEYEWLGHEMGHQWFPHAVTFDPPGFQYLEEALAEYGGIRVVDALGGTDAVRRLRTSGYEFDPIYSAAAYFRLVGAGVDTPLATMGNGINERNLAYNKGALMFDMLSREVGPARFRAVLQGLTSGRRLGTITWQQFRAAVDAGAGRDMKWFFDQWLNRAGAPDFRLDWQQDGGVVRGTISQSAPYYRAHLRIDAEGVNGERIANVVEVAGGSTAFELTPAFTVVRMELDPDYEVLRWTPEYHALADSVRRNVGSEGGIPRNSR
ncbi:MAG TPA: M1 family aminopeptidase [Gemmatimonadaceae bacterium]